MSLTVDSGQTLQRCLALDIGGTKNRFCYSKK